MKLKRKTHHLFLNEIPAFGYMISKFRENDKIIKKYVNYIGEDKIAPVANDKLLVSEATTFFGKYFKGYNDIRWHLIYAALSGIRKPGYIPYDLWRSIIEPQLNPPHLARAYTDKNLYDKIFNYNYLPKTICRLSNNTLYDADYNPVSIETLLRNIKYNGRKLIIKPAIHSGRGRKVRVMEKDGLEDALYNMSTNESWIIQEYVEQHPDVARYHPASLNTVRIVTLHYKNDYVVLAAVLKIGANNNIVDNIGAGGIFVGIDRRGGLNNYGLNKEYKRFEQHPDTGMEFGGRSIPSFDKVELLVKYLHRYLYNFKVVSWDVAITAKGEPIVIEYNLYNQSMDIQCFSGPIFGAYTDYVLSCITVPHYMKILSSYLFSIRRQLSYRKISRYRKNIS